MSLEVFKQWNLLQIIVKDRYCIFAVLEIQPFAQKFSEWILVSFLLIGSKMFEEHKMLCLVVRYLAFMLLSHAQMCSSSDNVSKYFSVKSDYSLCQWLIWVMIDSYFYQDIESRWIGLLFKTL